MTNALAELAFRWRLTAPDPLLLGLCLGALAAVILGFVWMLWRPR